MDLLRRGDLIIIALRGDYGERRPVLVVQSDLFTRHPSLTVLPVTSDLRDTPIFRIRVEPDHTNGLKDVSQIMVDKIQTVSVDKVGEIFGRVDDVTLLAVTRALAVWLGFA